MTTSVTALPTPEVRDLNAEIKSLMGRYDVTQMMLSAVLELSQAGVSNRLRGTVPWKVDELLKIAGTFGVHPAVLFGGVPPSAPVGPSGGPGGWYTPRDSNPEPAGLRENVYDLRKLAA